MQTLDVFHVPPPAGSATFINRLRTRIRTPTHSTLSVTHTPDHHGTGRRQDLASSHLPPRNGLFLKWNKAERARLAPGTGNTPPTPGSDSIHRSSLVAHHHLSLRSSSLARSLAHCTWARMDPFNPSLMLQPAARNGKARYGWSKAVPCGQRTS